MYKGTKYIIKTRPINVEVLVANEVFYDYGVQKIQKNYPIDCSRNDSTIDTVNTQ